MTHTHPKSQDVYRHYKHGALYRVICVATREADLVPCVVYESLDPEAGHRCWIRSIEDFCADVVLDGGSIAKRFALVEATS